MEAKRFLEEQNAESLLEGSARTKRRQKGRMWSEFQFIHRQARIYFIGVIGQSCRRFDPFGAGKIAF